MPPLALHTGLARRLADQLRDEGVDSQRGNLYLGATAPDIRVLTRWERRRTHFFDLDCFDEQSGVSGFFAAYPALANAGAVSPATRAFVAGYVTHLVMDEMWIGAIYRPWFGRGSPLDGSLRANIFDRALQFSMDADERADTGLMAHVLQSVATSDLDLQVDFLDRETLGKWREIILEYVGRAPDWERFRDRARRHLGETGYATDEACEELALGMPELVAQALAYLTPERVQEWMNETVDASTRAVREYLLCA